MSDHVLHFIPEDPAARPTDDESDKALRLLQGFVGRADKIVADSRDEIRFIDAGENWEGVRCPNCSADLDTWFLNDAMDIAFANAFRDLNATTPCCGQQVSLNDLRFGWPVGFARYDLEALNPERDPTPAQQAELEAVLGVKLRKIQAHV